MFLVNGGYKPTIVPSLLALASRIGGLDYRLTFLFWLAVTNSAEFKSVEKICRYELNNFDRHLGRIESAYILIQYNKYSYTPVYVLLRLCLQLSMCSYKQ